ncbi:uroporphyrinogen-III synthase [Aurantimicrobium minutum]|uniref:uroporphyrinogen-III synthase n=1 Tax=Aurantimicrobium minutum TaxID=708131 RepID=UPI0024756E96|nr:uroporphyrinogen-III synthase [Aurantimicrobium minutum]
MSILLIRANRNEVDQSALESYGVDCIVDPYLSIAKVHNPVGIARLREALIAPGNKWLVATSTNALSFFQAELKTGELQKIIQTQRDLRFAAIGAETEKQLREVGAEKVLRSSEADSQSLAKVIAETEPCPVVIPSSSIAMKSLSQTLNSRGFELIEEVIYATESVTHIPASVKQIAANQISGVLLRSPSAARAFVGFNGIVDLPVFCAGRTTATQAGVLGLTVSAVSADPSPETVALTISEYLKAHSS